MSRLRWIIVLASLAGILLAGSAMAGTTARSAATCKAPKYPGVGYFTSLSVKHVSCATGKKVAIAYYNCRLRHGKAGRCHSKVLGYTCKETRNSIPTEIDARVTCRLHRKTVIHTYQQDL